MRVRDNHVADYDNIVLMDSVNVYERVWLADFFHAFPHIDLSFRYANSTFNPSSASYRETLGFWACVPLVWCILLWLAFLIFFCVRVCCKSQRKQKKTTCSRLSAGIFILFGCGALGVGFFGNENVHSGVGSFVTAVVSVNRTIAKSLDVLDLLHQLAEDVKMTCHGLLRNATDLIDNSTVHDKIDSLINDTESKISEIQADISIIGIQARKVNTQLIVEWTQNIEYYRWVGTMAVFSVYIIVFLFILLGLLKKSKLLLVLFAIVSIFLLSAIWSSTSFYLALSVAAGDLCVDPDSYVMSRVSGIIDKDVLRAYIGCKDEFQPYQEQIMNAEQSVTLANTSLNTIVNMSLPFNISQQLKEPLTILRNDLRVAYGNLSSLMVQIGQCENIHDNYIDAVNGVCRTGLVGIGFLVMISAVLGMCSVIVVVCISQAWPYFGRSGRGYSPVDDTDPFLPSPPIYGRGYGSISRPADISTINQSTRNINDSMRRSTERLPDYFNEDSPPPSYHAGGYMQQYNQLAPRPTNITQSSEI